VKKLGVQGNVAFPSLYATGAISNGQLICGDGKMRDLVNQAESQLLEEGQTVSEGPFTVFGSNEIAFMTQGACA